MICDGVRIIAPQRVNLAVLEPRCLIQYAVTQRILYSCERGLKPTPSVVWGRSDSD